MSWRVPVILILTPQFPSAHESFERT